MTADIQKEIKEVAEHIRETGEYDRLVAVIVKSPETKEYRMSFLTESLLQQQHQQELIVKVY